MWERVASFLRDEIWPALIDASNGNKILAGAVAVIGAIMIWPLLKAMLVFTRRIGTSDELLAIRIHDLLDDREATIRRLQTVDKDLDRADLQRMELRRLVREQEEQIAQLQQERMMLLGRRQGRKRDSGDRRRSSDFVARSERDPPP